MKNRYKDNGMNLEENGLRESASDAPESIPNTYAVAETSANGFAFNFSWGDRCAGSSGCDIICAVYSRAVEVLRAKQVDEIWSMGRGDGGFCERAGQWGFCEQSRWMRAGLALKQAGLRGG